MQVALFLSWAWCPGCKDWLVHKTHSRLSGLTCPACKRSWSCTIWSDAGASLTATGIPAVDARLAIEGLIL